MRGGSSIVSVQLTEIDRRSRENLFAFITGSRRSDGDNVVKRLDKVERKRAVVF